MFHNTNQNWPFRRTFSISRNYFSIEQRTIVLLSMFRISIVIILNNLYSRLYLGKRLTEQLQQVWTKYHSSILAIYEVLIDDSTVNRSIDRRVSLSPTFCTNYSKTWLIKYKIYVFTSYIFSVLNKINFQLNNHFLFCIIINNLIYSISKLTWIYCIEVNS